MLLLVEEYWMRWPRFKIRAPLFAEISSRDGRWISECSASESCERHIISTSFNRSISLLQEGHSPDFRFWPTYFTWLYRAQYCKGYFGDEGKNSNVQLFDWHRLTNLKWEGTWWVTADIIYPCVTNACFWSKSDHNKISYDSVSTWLLLTTFFRSHLCSKGLLCQATSGDHLCLNQHLNAFPQRLIVSGTGLMIIVFSLQGYLF